MKLFFFVPKKNDKNFGSGHYTRIWELYKFLSKSKEIKKFSKKKELKLSFHPISSIKEAQKYLNKKEKNLCLFDLREIDPRPLLTQAKVLCLDNQHPLRKRWEKEYSNNLFFYDTLPHPNVDLQTALAQALLAPPPSPIPSLFSSPFFSSSKKILLCNGPFIKLPPLSLLLEKIKAIYPNIEKGIFFGEKIPSETSFWKKQKRLAHKDFLRLLQKSYLVFCYPGQSMLEALYLKKKVILIRTESQIHNDLSKYINQKMSLPYFEKERDIPIVLENIQKKVYRENLDMGKGYILLSKKIYSLLNSYQKKTINT